MGRDVSADDFSQPDGMRFLADACRDLEIDADLTSILLACSREIKVDLPLRRDDGTLTVLPCLEYFLCDDHPIRTPDDKIKSNGSKVLGLASG